jgi:hypothetical protein
MKENAGIRKLSGKFSSIKSRSGGEERKMKALELLMPRIVIPKEIFGFRSKDLLMITIATTCLIAPLVATIVLWLIVY